jgi:2-haloacid dehalogenase
LLQQRLALRSSGACNGLPWDAILVAEFARDLHKPKAVMYQRAAIAFDASPRGLSWPQRAAASPSAWLRTAHIARPDEKGPGRGEHGPSVAVEFAARDLLDLAAQLDARAPRRTTASRPEANA